jgi:hypothetical protein
MMPNRARGLLVSLALLGAAMPALLVGCSGSATAPAVTSYNPAPAVVISGASSAPATGPVTFTFTFSEAMTAFPVSAVAVTGGTPATSTAMVSANQFTLVVTPPAASTGTIQLNVAAGAFTDAAGAANTSSASASQAYNTVVSAASYTVIDFTTALPSGQAYLATDFSGDGSTLMATGYPAGTGAPTGTVDQIIKGAGAASYAGTTLSVGYLGSIGQIPFSATHQTLTAVVHAPAAGIDIMLKLEDANNAANFAQADATTSAAGWQTLTFNFLASTTNSVAVNLADSYDKLTIFPDFGNAGVTSPETFYLGPISFQGASAPAAPPLSVTASYTVLDFNTTLGTGLSYKVTSFNAEVSALVSTGVPSGFPAGTGPAVLQTIVPAGTSPQYSGVTLGEGYLSSIGALPFFANGATSPTATTMTMVLNAPAAGIDIKLKIANASNTNQSVETDELTTAAGWQTLTFNFANVATGTAALNSAYPYNLLSIFPNFASTLSSPQTFYIGPITFVGAAGPLAPPLSAPALAQPTAAAATPAPAAASVIALYNSSAKYSDFPVATWDASWSNTTYSTFAIPSTGSTVLEYSPLQYAGIQIPAAIPATSGLLNLTGMNYLHVDLWTPNATQFGVQLVSFTGGASAATGVNEILFDSSRILQNTWVSLEIDLSAIPLSSGAADFTSIGQILWLDNKPSTTDNGTFYIDNVYFHQ